MYRVEQQSTQSCSYDIVGISHSVDYMVACEIEYIVAYGDEYLRRRRRKRPLIALDLNDYKLSASRRGIMWLVNQGLE